MVKNSDIPERQSGTHHQSSTMHAIRQIDHDRLIWRQRTTLFQYSDAATSSARQALAENKLHGMEHG